MWIEKAKKYDFSRGTRMAAFRFFLLTPLENRWMIFAERKFTERTIFNLTKKVSIDQFMIGPILMICFFTYNEGESFFGHRYSALDGTITSHGGVMEIFCLALDGAMPPRQDFNITTSLTLEPLYILFSFSWQWYRRRKR